MASKSTFLVLGVILAVCLLISSDVAARELAEDTKKESTKVKSLETGGVQPQSCLIGCCEQDLGGCRRCC